MKVSGSGASGPVSGPGAPKSKDGGGFSPAAGGLEEVSSPPMTAMPSGVTSLDALLALQETSTPTERRRRAVVRADRMLDMLDQVKLALLDGQVSGESLERLRVTVGETRAQTEDPGLEGVLNEIETRAMVELAKQDMARTAA